MSGEEPDAHCECGRPEFHMHGGWWRCRNCQGWLPYVDRPGALAIMRERIAEGRAALARKWKS